MTIVADWKDGLEAALLTFLQGRVPEAVELISWDEMGVMGGHCETCEQPDVRIDFHYRREDGTWGIFRHDGSFVDLLREL